MSKSYALCKICLTFLLAEFYKEGYSRGNVSAFLDDEDDDTEMVSFGDEEALADEDEGEVEDTDTFDMVWISQ